MRIVVCEDEPFYQTAIAEAIERWQSASGHTDVELSVFSSSEDVLEAIEHEAEIDLLFVDIQIPGEMSGIDLARRIREACLDMTIVFCTNYNEYVFEGYTVNALRYLKKPVSQEDINYCCSYVYNRLAIRNDHALTLFSGGKRYVLRYIEIRCIEARLRNLLFLYNAQRRADSHQRQAGGYREQPAKEPVRSLPPQLHREHRPCADAHADGVPAVKR